jgi:transposase-like protein
MSTTHSVPLSCPYCTGDDLHPHGAEHGAWECRECLRVFSVRFIGLLSLAGDPGSEQRQHVTRGTPS